MVQFSGVRDHYRQVMALFQEHFFYLSSLDFFLGLQLLIVGGGGALMYFGNFPLWLALPIMIGAVGVFNLSLTGVSKNTLALARERDPGKYPLFIKDYWWLGLPILASYLLVSVLPVLFLVVMVATAGATQYAGWPYFLAAGAILYLLWQWRFGLAPAAVLDQKCPLPEALRVSCRLTGRRGAASLGVTLINQAVLVVFSCLPLVGTFWASNWLSLSAFRLYWGLKNLPD